MSRRSPAVRRAVESSHALQLEAARVTERANALACLYHELHALHRRALTTGTLPTLTEISRLLELVKGLR